MSRAAADGCSVGARASEGGGGRGGGGGGGGAGAGAAGAAAASRGRAIVVAIDLGTARSGYAYYINPGTHAVRTVLVPPNHALPYSLVSGLQL